MFRLRETLRNLRLALYILKSKRAAFSAMLRVNAAYHVCEGKHIIRIADIIFLRSKNISFRLQGAKPRKRQKARANANVTKLK